ncbi:hypothetical protein B0A55_06764 [Friedmanniomyces simplex]|uniref:Piwi domain-containing protein n=1 Tax=Friedmanniomyces simplex TaxID=329884 RepID=A0A4U0X755_9PEZI|nr:hypothetical protein B0A55_06764 [Friedmanniomyces simplex]
MGGRQKQSTKTPAKKATPKSNPELCIRCPDRETAEKRSHHNDLDKCFNDFPSRQVGNTPATHTVDQLWWGFSSGKVSADLKLSKPLVREAFFEYAKTVGEKFRPELMDSEIEERNKAVGLVAAKRDAEWKIPQEGRVISISKEALEAAFGAVQRETERKKAETENLKAEKGMRKTGASVLDQDAASAGSATGAAGIRPASAAAGSGKPPGKPSADLKGAGTGTGKPSTDGKTGNSGGGSGQGIPLRDGPPTSSGTADPTRTTQSEIHVYAVDMVRAYGNGNVPITVKKNVDRRLVIEMLKTSHYSQYLGVLHSADRGKKWVTDGDLIWSVVPLFDPNDPAIVPQPLQSSGAVQIRYVNETGIPLDLEEITLSFVRSIDLTRHVGEMFYDTSIASYDDSDPGLITRGLDAFFSRFARESRQNVSTSANKSFSRRPQPLDTNTAQQTLSAMTGYVLSVRPGIESMYLNVNHATSPFFEPVLVSNFIDWSRRLGRSEGELRAVLEGVKVRIMYDKRREFTAEDQRMRFITSVGATIRLGNGATETRSYIGNTRRRNANGRMFDAQNHPIILPGVPCRVSTQALAGVTTVQDWYAARANPNILTDDDFPTSNLNLQPNVWAVNVGRDNVRSPDGVEWYPANQLMIQSGQPVRGRLTPNQTTAMLRVAVHPPQVHKPRILGQEDIDGMFHFGFAGNADAGAGKPAGGNRSATDSQRPDVPLNQAFLQTVNTQADIEMTQIPGKWLSRPTLMYGRHNLIDNAGQGWGLANVNRTHIVRPRDRPGSANWNLLHTGFATKVNLPTLAVLDFQRTSTQQWQQDVYNRILQVQLYGHGLIPSTGVNVQWHAAPNLGRSQMDLTWEIRLRTELGVLLGNLQQPHPPILIFLEGYSLDDYACVKRVTDLQLGVQTICAVGGRSLGRWDQQTVSNIALKYNVKRARDGRDNHHFDDNSLKILRSTAQRADIIVVGADVTHPGKGSASATPSIAAVVGSADDHFMQYPGSMRLQKCGKEDIVDLSGMVKERLLEWARRHHNNLPAKILFYRDGVSESQYDLLRRRELPQMQLVFNEAYRHLHPGAENLPPTGIPAPDHSKSNWQGISRVDRVQKEKKADEEWAANIEGQSNNLPFKMTFVVVGKRHNTRFYDTDGRSKMSGNNSNVKPGLVVDEVITHPYGMDFYLQSHEPIKGTGRSAHYFVLRNNMALTADKLQSITHTLCYAYARATRGVSYCAPAYYADRLCDRDRSYLRHYLINHSNFQPRHQRHQGPTAETYDQYSAAIIDAIEHDPRFRPQIALGQTVRQNPWHPDIDDTMFYL